MTAPTALTAPDRALEAMKDLGLTERVYVFNNDTHRAPLQAIADRLANGDRDRGPLSETQIDTFMLELLKAAAVDGAHDLWSRTETQVVEHAAASVGLTLDDIS